MTTDEPGLLLRDAEVIGRGTVDVRVLNGCVTAVGTSLSARVEKIVECGGSALLPGLHDHHCHVLASAAASRSVQCGPPDVRDAATLSARLHAATPRDGWIRGVGYDEAVAGDLDATALDALGPPSVPTRIQHRSGAMWVMNTVAIARCDLDTVELGGIERDGAGRATGRLWRLDAWLRQWIPVSDEPDVRSWSMQMALRGVTGVTDATPDLPADAVRAIVDGGLVQRLVSLGEEHGVAGVGLGPRKIVVPDHELPGFDALRDLIRASRPRAVALHCVTRASLVLTLSALEDAGTIAGDRIEHAAVAPSEAHLWMKRLGLTVVTQPSLIVQRGDDYLSRVDSGDGDVLWPFRSLLNAGVPVGCSSDAPYGDGDPWASIAAAVHRRTLSGERIASHEAVAAWQALRGFLTRADRPGGAPRRVAPGEPADLALLDRPLREALSTPLNVHVAATIVRGRLVRSL